MSEHTPGPWMRQGQWNTSRGLAECIEADGWGIIGAWIDQSNEPDGNSRLIAVAPELHEICEAVADLMEQPDEWPDDSFTCVVPVDIIRKAHAILRTLT